MPDGKGYSYNSSGTNSQVRIHLPPPVIHSTAKATHAIHHRSNALLGPDTARVTTTAHATTATGRTRTITRTGV